MTGGFQVGEVGVPLDTKTSPRGRCRANGTSAPATDRLATYAEQAQRYTVLMASASPETLAVLATDEYPYVRGALAS